LATPSGRGGRRPAPRDVYINGGAAIAGASLGCDAVWDRVCAARDVDAAEVHTSFDAEALLGRKGLRKVDRGALLLGAALALDLPDWPGPQVPNDRAGAVVGSAVPAYGSVIAIMREFQRGGATQVKPMLVQYATANCASSWWLMRRGI